MTRTNGTRKGKILGGLALVLMVTAMTILAFCNETRIGATPTPQGPSGVEKQSAGTDGGVPDLNDPGCTDPKTCGEPRLPTPPRLDAGLRP
jgi:hypothetical protein